MSEYDELAGECNEILNKLRTMDEFTREQWVADVLDWFIDITKSMQEEVNRLQGMNKIALIKKLKEISNTYKPLVEERKPELIVALTYAIKPQYQEKLAPLLYYLLGLV